MIANEDRKRLRSWVLDPYGSGRIAPSDRALADLLARPISMAAAPIIVLGGGLDAFVRRIVGDGIPSGRIALVDQGSEAAAALRLEYPTIGVHWIDPAALAIAAPFGEEKAGVVVSSLPLRFLPPGQALRVLNAAFTQLRRDGAFYQVTCGAGCPIPAEILGRLRLDASRVGTVLANMPPVTVYRIARRWTGLSGGV